MKKALFLLAPMFAVAAAYGCGSSDSSSGAGGTTSASTTASTTKATTGSNTGATTGSNTATTTGSPTSSTTGSNTTTSTGPSATTGTGGGGGAGGAGGGATDCDPVTGCGGMGDCDINPNEDGFTCYNTDPSDGAICAACDENMTFCADGMTCLVTAGQCARYCCTDADCGTGTCNMTTLTTDRGLSNAHGVGVCTTTGDAGTDVAACDAPATSVSMGSCYTP